MNEIENKVLELVNQAQAGITAIAPEIIRQKLLFGLVDGIIGIVIGTGILYSAYRFYNKGKFLFKKHNDNYIPVYGFSAFCTLIGFLCTVLSSMQVIQIKIAPYVYLLEQLKK